jgi:predicted aconitase with swiveling domain
MTKKYNIRKIVRGSAEGEAIVIPHSFAFMGDVDMETSEIIAEGNPNKGKTIKDKILIYTETKGSSGGMVVLMTLVRKGIAPAAIITIKPVDYNLAEGAILAKVPFACEPDGDIINEIKTGDFVRVNTNEGFIEVLRQ